MHVGVPVQDLVPSSDGQRFVVIQDRNLTLFDSNLNVIGKIRSPGRGSIFTVHLLSEVINETRYDSILVPSTEGLLHLSPLPPINLSNGDGGDESLHSRVLSTVHGIECPSYLSLVRSNDKTCLWVLDMRSITRVTLSEGDLSIRHSLEQISESAIARNIGRDFGNPFNLLESDYDLSCCGVDFDSLGSKGISSALFLTALQRMLV